MNDNTEYYIIDLNYPPLEDEINNGIIEMKRKRENTWKYFFYKYFCCVNLNEDYK